MSFEHPSLSREYIEAFSGQKLISFCICFMILLTGCLVLRFWARRVKGGIGLDDYLSIPSYLLCVGLCGLGIGTLVFHFRYWCTESNRLCRPCSARRSRATCSCAGGCGSLGTNHHGKVGHCTCLSLCPGSFATQAEHPGALLAIHG